MERPPPPPPHGTHPGGGRTGGRTGGLPDGRYDIFVVPPHSSGSGFLYLPSLQTQRNSFLAGCFCTAASFFVYTTAVPVVKEWLISTVNGGGAGVFMLICFVAVGAWAFGKTQSEWSHNDSDSGFRAGQGPGGQSGPRPSGYANTGHTSGHTAGPPPPNHESSAPPPNPGTSAPPPQPSWQRSPPQANTKANTTNQKSSWDKAREETRKREEERKRAEELKKRKEELDKERQKQREKDALERFERERREKKEKEDKANMTAKLEKEKLRQAAELARAKAEADAAARERTEGPTPRRPPMPSAATEREDDAYSFRPYDRPRRAHKANSAASMYSESTYAPSVSTARTTPPPTARGPYSTTDPDKIIIKGVFSFNNAFTRTPISQLVSNQGQVSDGLILRITTEGLFIDDDVRGVPQREWDVKAWTMKSAESCEIGGMHILRASIRDLEGRKFVFILSQSEGWKVAVGLQRLRRGKQVQAFGVAGLPQNEAKAILHNLGFG
ncbi:hypothetical protein PV10_08939 [Exophiala mesophila]|uniref:Uncharacterized protein n=1 Tax=Exophiala mesophila TaxID=212818 RepID=A0A0D1ZRF9_EXOME|nr:uncharacterized protein PV10_08939 [Exophiala mesophila]KIV89363.1 hypothetical protein PV10_08939 [Exophiala mesophila]